MSRTLNALQNRSRFLLTLSPQEQAQILTKSLTEIEFSKTHCFNKEKTKEKQESSLERFLPLQITEKKMRVYTKRKIQKNNELATDLKTENRKSEILKPDCQKWKELNHELDIKYKQEKFYMEQNYVNPQQIMPDYVPPYYLMFQYNYPNYSPGYYYGVKPYYPSPQYDNFGPYWFR